jgi:aqualysin 1
MMLDTWMHPSRAFLTVTIALTLSITVMVNRASGQMPPNPGHIRHSHQPVQGRFLVSVRSNADPETVALLIGKLARGRVRHVYRHGFRGFSIEGSEATARVAASDPSVAYVERDAVVEAVAQQSLDESDSWGLDRLDQRAIVDGTSALDGQYRYSSDGSGVHVYVVDTGIRTTHVEFGGRAFTAFDVVGDGLGGGDCNGHGTHVAATVGGSRFGVAKFANLHSVRVLGCDGHGYVSGLVAAIDWIIANHIKPAVINISIGAGLSRTFGDAVRSAIAADITVVGAAGNDDSDSCNGLMGGASGILVVSASSYGDRREPYANYGPCVDLFAPGENITSADARSDTDSTMMSGTSMAAPHVAGAAALYLQHNSEASPAQVAAAITRSATTGVITDPGRDSPNRLLFTPHFGDTTRPTVSVTAPLVGAIVRGMDVVRVSADDDIEMAGVTFFACGAQIGTDSVAPYSIDWDSDSSPDGDCTVDVKAYDRAGNVTTARVRVVIRNVHDQTPPHITLVLQGDGIPPSGRKLVPVTFIGSVSDDGSLIGRVSFTTHDEYGVVQPSGTAAIANGRFRFTVYLEARRLGRDRDGRRYVMSVTASDVSGNRASAIADAIVWHHPR